MRIITQIGKITQKPQKGVFMILALRSLKQECKLRSSRAFARTTPSLAHRPREGGRPGPGVRLAGGHPGSVCIPARACGAVKGSRAGEGQTP